MKTLWVAIQNAGKFGTISQFSINKVLTFTIIGMLILCTSCENNAVLENINNVKSTENNSVIIYTNNDPEFSSETIGDVYNLDLNNDLIVDFTLLSIKDTDNLNYLVISGTGNNKFISVTPWYASPVPLDKSSEIFNLVGYKNGETYESIGYFTIGNCFGGEALCYEDWKNRKNKYLGLKFSINGQMHYGWVQMDVTSPTQWVIKDYAYNPAPLMSILAGEK